MISKNIIAMSAILLLPANAVAAPTQTYSKEIVSHDATKQIAILNKSIGTVKNALHRYYANEKSWPSNLSVLESKGYLPDNYTSFIGEMTYGEMNNTLVLTINLPEGKEGNQVALRTASLTGAKASGSSISLQITPKVGFIDENLYIDRFNPKALATDINLNNHWVKNGNLQGGTIDVTQAKGDTLAVNRDVTVARNVLVAGQLTGSEGNLANTAYQNNVNALAVTANAATVVSGKTQAATATMKGSATFQENATISAKATANGPMRTNSSLSIAGSAVFNNAANFKDMNLSNTMTAAGGITGTQATFQQGLVDQVQAKDVIANDANVTGKVNAGNVQAENIYAVNGEFSGNLTTQGLITKNAVQANNGLYVGTDNVMVADKDGNLYQRGKQLAQVYLGKDAKAADTALLDGMSSSEYSVLSQDRTFSLRNSFNGLVQFNSIGYAGGKKFIDPTTGQLSEAGQTLDSRYLGINAKAADSALLDGLASSAFGQLAAANTFSQRATFTQGLRVNGNLSSGGTMVASNGQWVEGGQALTLRYLGIHGKAADSALLDGVSSGQLARRDTNNVFTGSNTFSQDVTVGGQALLGSVRAVESRTGSLEGRVASTNSQLDNLLYIKSRCKVHAKDPGCQFVFTPKEPELKGSTINIGSGCYQTGQAGCFMMNGFFRGNFGSLSPDVLGDGFTRGIGAKRLSQGKYKWCVLGKPSYGGYEYYGPNPVRNIKVYRLGVWKDYYFNGDGCASEFLHPNDVPLAGESLKIEIFRMHN